MSDSPLNLFGSRRRKKRRQAKLAAMNPAEKAAYQAKRQAAMSKFLPGGMGNIAAQGLTGVGQATSGGDVQSQISEINSKLDTLTGGGGSVAGVANNVIQAPEPAEPASDIGDDVDVVDGDSALAKLRKYKGSCKMKKNN